MYFLIYTDVELQNYSFRDATLKYYVLAKFNGKQCISHYLWSGEGRIESICYPINHYD